MPIGFQSNILATKTIGAMQRSSTLVSRVNQRLSSGLRINSASDDPAGLSAVMRLGTDARIANRATRNINDGISALQIADGAYESASSVVARFGEIAAIAANGNLNNTQRSALNQEVGALRGELLRIRSSLSFNGRELLTGEGVNANGTTIATSVSTGNSYEPQVSADGRYVTYRTSGGVLNQLDTKTGNTNRIATGVGFFSASSQGDYVAYENGSGLVRLYDRLSNTSSLIANAVGVDLLAVSDNGEKIAFISRNAFSSAGASLGNNGQRNLAVITTATGAINGDNGANLFTSYSSLAISADGSRVALVGSAGAIYNSSSSSLSALMPFIYSGITATKVAFDSTNDLIFRSASDVGGLNGSGIANIYRLDDETEFSQLTNITDGNGVTNFFVTDNGQSVSFITTNNIANENPSRYAQIFKADLNGNITQRSKFTSTVMNNFSTIAGDGNSAYTLSGGTVQQYNLFTESNFQIETGTGAAGVLNSPIRALDAAIRALYYWDVSTQRNARLSVELAAGNVEQLASARGELGSAMARLETALRATDAKANELTAARDRIQDVDVAAEVSEQIRLAVLGNTQVNLLSSASKLVPEIALQLLKSAGSGVGS
jgi:flagellin